MPLALCVIAYHVTQIIGFGALAVVDSILLALVRPLIACVDLAASIETATTRRLVAALACLVDTFDRRANRVTKLSGPALTALADALHRGYVGNKRRPIRDARLDIWRALQPVTAPTWLERLVQTHDTVVMILSDGDPSEPYIRRITAVGISTAYARHALATAHTYRGISVVF